ncbi:hypothetical protein ACOMICROBIO_EPCKBFOG_00478 [Vibrio sp. B1FLJ16]|nr:hypothetical protein ACOMICROBIO_EPCKBFOG_00478 [Vibrio sp. B1FLJ16]CAD7799375.1 hypothetical protein ACOMICROBIO_FLGHMIGD_00477 [Vibrio sp. B1FLJ16]CAE6885070.1 hypothetical protein ACOMICROBIO_FLGHMIGD_00477 [Vibrio sp. B1FLJ16]CAE6886031.1 hypothetical protein ACOMICROBIO_EPCKBFOG_00478 [Vibrio sp. B1FLJ16]
MQHFHHKVATIAMDASFTQLESTSTTSDQGRQGIADTPATAIIFGWPLIEQLSFMQLEPCLTDLAGYL